MNRVHRIDLPRIVLVGHGVVDSVGDVCGELSIEKPLIVTGRKTYEIAGGRAKAILVNEGFDVELTYCSAADLATVDRIRKEAQAMGADAILGIGGGRTIDVAKLSAFRSEAYFISVPTTASHDGIASSSASIKGFDKPYSVKAKSPIAVLADSNIIEESPYRFTASGCGDIVGKTVSVEDWRMSHDVNGEYYGEYAASLALMSSNLIMRNALLIRERLEEGYRTLLEALVSCGVAMSIAGSSRPCSGSEHLFSHTLDMLAPGAAMHGEQCGVGAIMMANLHGLDWHELKESLRIIGAPTTAGELGVGRDTIVKALVKAKEIRPDRYTILNTMNLTRETAEILASECGVI
ncbi:NAD(P)-dependent glycerol-1-phosphate dehydrogenase [Candidatus Bathyarchaeota archaeon]|nr:NAD(P)-dependent glycerol-1-phosphate dehydrogenase [Candidatus Bathyarchaeota archaeon]